MNKLSLFHNERLKKGIPFHNRISRYYKIKWTAFNFSKSPDVTPRHYWYSRYILIYSAKDARARIFAVVREEFIWVVQYEITKREFFPPFYRFLKGRNMRNAIMPSKSPWNVYIRTKRLWGAILPPWPEWSVIPKYFLVLKHVHLRILKTKFEETPKTSLVW